MYLRFHLSSPYKMQFKLMKPKVKFSLPRLKMPKISLTSKCNYKIPRFKVLLWMPLKLEIFLFLMSFKKFSKETIRIPNLPLLLMMKMSNKKRKRI